MPHARTTDPETSHEAAESVRSLTGTQNTILYLFAKFKHLTDDQLQAHYRRMVSQGDAPRASESGIRSRRAELVALGKLQDSGERVKLDSGRNAILWMPAVDQIG